MYTSDLNYRVRKVRLWGSEYFDGFQFIYQHYLTGEVVESEIVETHRVRMEDTTMVEMELKSGEHINSVSGREGHWTDSLTLSTNCGRSITTGGTGGDDFFRRITHQHEVRGLDAEWTTWGEIRRVEPRTIFVPNKDSLMFAYSKNREAYGETKSLDSECCSLINRLTSSYSDLVEILDRDIVYPIVPAAKLYTVLQQATKIFQLCKHRIRLMFGARQEALDAMTVLLSDLDDIDELIRTFPQAEVVHLNMAGTTDSDPRKVRVALMNALENNKHELASALYIRNIDQFTKTDFHERLLRCLLINDDAQNLDHVIRAFAEATNQSVPHVMASFKNQTPSPLQHAIYEEKPAVMEWLLIEARMDPFEEQCDDESCYYGHLTPLQLLDHVKDEEIEKRMRCLFTHLMNRRDFQTETLMLGTADIVSFDQLTELVPKVTSVFDYQPLYTYGLRHLDAQDFKNLTIMICEHIMQEKLVLDNNAAVFFKMALKQTRKQGHITQMEYEKYKIMNTQVNMEGAEWVLEIKQSIQKMQNQVDFVEAQVKSLQQNVKNLREALIEREEMEQQRRRCEQIVSLISMALFAIGGPVFKALQDALNLAEPLNLLFATVKLSEPDIAEFLADKTAEILYHDGVQRVLEEAEVDPQEFVQMLRDAVLLEHPELAGRDGSTRNLQRESDPSLASVTASSNSTSATSFGSSEKKFSFRDVVLRYKQQMSVETEHERMREHGHSPIQGSLSSVSTSPTSVEDSLSSPGKSGRKIIVDEENLVQYPYHFAVFDSQGDLGKFKEFESWFDEGDGDVNSTMNVIIEDSGAPIQATKQMNPHVYASYLGYVEIVDYLLLSEDLVPTEKKFVTKRRARQNATFV